MRDQLAECFGMTLAQVTQHVHQDVPVLLQSGDEQYIAVKVLNPEDLTALDQRVDVTRVPADDLEPADEIHISHKIIRQIEACQKPSPCFERAEGVNQCLGVSLAAVVLLESDDSARPGQRAARRACGRTS